MKKFRLLEADEIECRVQQITEKGLILLLYKTARTDADLLDETVGADNWENDFKIIDDVLYGGIGVNYGSGFVWKWDAGTEGKTEKEKGRASDAYKRAGSKHGIGRELYSSPFIWIPAGNYTAKEHKGKLQCKDSFSVAKIGYDEKERISALTIVNDSTRKICFNFSAGKSSTPPAPVVQKETPSPAETNKDELYFSCEECGKRLEPYKDDEGKTVSLRKHAEGSRKTFGRVLCLECINAL